MAKYHVNPKTNRPNICKANKQGCPLQAQGAKHFDSKEEASAYAEKSLSENTNLYASSQKKKEKSKKDYLLSNRGQGRGLLNYAPEVINSAEFKKDVSELYDKSARYGSRDFQYKSVKVRGNSIEEMTRNLQSDMAKIQEVDEEFVVERVNEEANGNVNIEIKGSFKGGYERQYVSLSLKSIPESDRNIDFSNPRIEKDLTLSKDEITDNFYKELKKTYPQLSRDNFDYEIEEVAQEMEKYRGSEKTYSEIIKEIEQTDAGWNISQQGASYLEYAYNKTVDINKVLSRDDNVMKDTGNSDWKKSLDKALAEEVSRRRMYKTLGYENAYSGGVSYMVDDEDDKTLYRNGARAKLVGAFNVKEDSWHEFKGTFYHGEHTTIGVSADLVFSNGEHYHGRVDNTFSELMNIVTNK